MKKERGVMLAMKEVNIVETRNKSDAKKCQAKPRGMFAFPCRG
jgi:hypothetical protein